MTDLAVIAAEPGALDQYADPGAFVVLSCERAKEWLTKCVAEGDIEQIVELKSQAEAIRVYTTAKQLGRDAELAAAEIVRRAERGIGLAIRRGQADGTVAKVGDASGPKGDYVRGGKIVHVDRVREPKSISPGEIFKYGEDSAMTYSVTDGVTDEMFDAAIAEAKEEGNLSRANVVRTVARKKIDAGGHPDKVAKAREMAGEGYTSRQIGAALGVARMSDFNARHGIEVPADKVVGKTRRIDPYRIIESTATSLEGLVMGVNLIDVATVDQAQLPEWVLPSMRESLKTLQRFLKEFNP